MAGRLPALFIGHDSPMNIVADNGYTRDLEALAAHLPRPAAILVVSAHWLTKGIAVVRIRLDSLTGKRSPARG